MPYRDLGKPSSKRSSSFPYMKGQKEAMNPPKKMTSLFMHPVTRSSLDEVPMDEPMLSPQDQPPALTKRRARSEGKLSRPTPLLQRSSSIYAQLNSEIVNYQKMAAELESLLEESGKSPEVQWRTRILIRSAQDADRDIWKRLYEYETTFGENPSNSRDQIACRKLHRDFRRAHKQLSSVLELYRRRQQVEVSFLTAAAPPEEKKEEEFFDRVMRERQMEIENIHTSLHKVNEIYTDLADLVDSQQEKVDLVAEKVGDSRGTTKAGAERLQQSSIGGMCAPLNVIHDQTSRTLQEEAENLGSDFTWSTPFETFRDDMQAVKKDVMDFGRDLIHDLKENVENKLRVTAPGLGFECTNQEYQLGKFTECNSSEPIYSPSEDPFRNHPNISYY